MTRRSLRLAAAAALTALVLPLAACQTHQGTAAYVGTARITTGDVEKQVDVFYADPFWGKQGQGKRAAVNNRTVNAMVLAELLKQTLVDEKVKLPDAAVDSTEKEFKAQPAQIPQGLQGSPPRIAAEVAAYVTAIQQKLAQGATSQEELNQRLNTALDTAQRRHPVTVNPRYGRFNTKTLGLEPGKDPGVRDLAETPSPNPQQSP